MENKPDNVVDIAPTDITYYNERSVLEFLEFVFPGQWEDALVFKGSKHKGPGLPLKDYPADLKRAAKNNHPRPWYFGTALCEEGEYQLRDGTIDVRKLNRKNLFKSLHVVVLDDIGTKVPLDKVKHITPSYIIETSPGNYQYGLVLEDAITHYGQAEALIQLVYHSGYTDGGGNLVTKAVRLPCGENGKEKHDGFPVTLTAFEGCVFTPQDILDLVRCSTTWDEIVADPLIAMRAADNTQLAAAAWSPYDAATPEGIIDPVLDWLYENGMVVQDTGGEFVDVVCPWHDSHTTGEVTAGYSPLGRGGKWASSRGFHCFHDHCKQQKVDDFLAYVFYQGGPAAARDNYAGELLTKLAWWGDGDRVVEVETGRMLKTSAARVSWPQRVNIMRYDLTNPKVKHAAAFDLWQQDVGKIEVNGIEYMPHSDSRLAISRADNRLKVNTFKPVAHPPPPAPTDEHIKRFTKHIEYLVPDEDEREYFMQWLAANVQDPTFRGAAVLMVSASQGVGRSSLGQMLKMLLGHGNVRDLSFNRMVNSRFNDWLECQMLICNEVRVSDQSGWRDREFLKDLVDPAARVVMVERKGIDAVPAYACYSTLMFSNHVNALKLDETDRRFYVIQNPEQPRPATYFTALHQWMAQGEWMHDVYEYLLNYPVTLDLMAAAPKTAARDAMIEAARPKTMRLLEAVREVWPHELIPTPLVASVAGQLGIDASALKQTIPPFYAHRTVIKVGGRAIAFRSRKTRQQLTATERTEARDLFEKYENDAEMQAAIRRAYADGAD